MKHKNIPKGYKDSPLGIIPKEWEVKRLGEISEISSGGTPLREKTEYWNGDIPWITTSLINQPIINKADEFITELGLYNSAAKIIKKGTLLMAMYGQGMTRGKVSKLNISAATNQACAAIQIKEHYTDYIFYTLDYLYYDIRSLSNDGGQKNLSLELIKNIKISIPSIVEQKKIAELLSTWDKAIDKQTKLIDALIRRKRALMQQLLTGKKRLPSFTKTWKTISLGDIFDERNETHKEDLPLLSITAERGVILQSESDKKDISNNDKSKYKRICPNDIGYNTMRMWQGRSALSTMEGIISPAYTVVTPKKNICPLFIASLFKHPRVIYNFWTHSQGLVNDTLNCKYPDFSQVKVNIPTFHEQKAITEVLIETHNEIELNQKRLHQFRTQKHSLMQLLLTGKRRIKI